MVHWMLCMLPFLVVWKIESYHSDMRGILTTSTILSYGWVFVGIIISFLQIAWMILIWFNMHIFYWGFVMIMCLCLRVVMACTLLYFPVSCVLDMDFKTFWTVLGSFLSMLSIQTLVLFLDVNSWLCCLLLSGWDVYDMLWCSKYCVTMPMGVPPGGKFTLA